MSAFDMKISAELRKAGAKLGREGLSLAVIDAVRQFDGSYKAAMVLAGRLKAVAHAAKADGYWSEKVEDGYFKQRGILVAKSNRVAPENLGDAGKTKQKTPAQSTPLSPTNTTLDEQERAQA
jgi:hypothetical protein